MNRAKIRTEIRAARNQLTATEQSSASNMLALSLTNQSWLLNCTNVAIYLANDSELDPHLLIKYLWQNNINVYVPILHPFKSGHLIFQKFQETTPMTLNKYNISEPKLNCSEVCPLEQLDVIFTPLVAFDKQGNRLGMGGGFYDRTLEHHYRDKRSKPEIIGLAHDCQKVERLPIEAWDIPLKTIVTPRQIHQF